MGRSNGLSTVASSGLVPTFVTHHHQVSRWKSITGTTSPARMPQPRKRLPSAKELASATTNDAPPCSPSMVRVMLRLLVALAGAFIQLTDSVLTISACIRKPSLEIKSHKS
jgi:hypothetical protein